MVFVTSSVLGGCGCSYPTSFFWDTRLVPAHDTDQVVSSSGLTDYVPAPPPAPVEVAPQ
jgi:hypothetical protein